MGLIGWVKDYLEDVLFKSKSYYTKSEHFFNFFGHKSTELQSSILAEEGEEVVEGDDSEWEEVECTGSDCEECRRTRAVAAADSGGITGNDRRATFYPPPPPAQLPPTTNFGAPMRPASGGLGGANSSSGALQRMVPTPSAGGLLHQYSMPSSLASKATSAGSGSYYCTTQLCAPTIPNGEWWTLVMAAFATVLFLKAKLDLIGVNLNQLRLG